MKLELKNQARELRKSGLSINEITLKTGASKSSVSIWVRDIRLSEQQQIELRGKGKRKCFGNTYAADFFRKKRKEYQKHGEKMVLEYGDAFLCGCMLYWGEGSKAKGRVSLINSDPHLVNYFLNFLKKYFGVSNDDVRLHCTYHDEADVKKVEKFWLDQLQLPKSCLWKSSEVKSMRKNYDMGMGSINVFKTEIVQAIYGAIQSHCGFVNNKWLK